MSGLAPHQHARQLRGPAPLAETAAALGISERQLRRIENCEHRRGPHPATRKAYARVFGVDPWHSADEGEALDQTHPSPARRAAGERLRSRRLQLGLTQQQVGEIGWERFRGFLRYVHRHHQFRLVWSHLGPHLAPATVSRYERGLTGGRWESALALALALDLDDVGLFELAGREDLALQKYWRLRSPKNAT